MKTILTLLLFSIVSVVFAQNKQTWRGQISTAGQPVPFATVSVYPKLNVTLADENGNLEFEYNTSDTIKITCIGFETRVLLGRDLAKIANLNLKQAVYELNEVEVKAKWKKEWWGIKERKSIMGNSWGPASEIALFIPNAESKSGFITKLRYFLPGWPSNSEKVPFRIHAYAVNSKGEPADKDLVPELVMVQTKKRRWVEIDVSQYGIAIPTIGFFVALELLSEQEFNYKETKTTFINTDSTRKKGLHKELLYIGTTDKVQGQHSWFKMQQHSWLNKNKLHTNLGKKEERNNFMMGAEVAY